MSVRPPLLAALLALPVTALAVPEGGWVYWVGSGATCDFNHLQTAINAVPDDSEIRIVDNQVYSDVAIQIIDKSLLLAGGWSDCAGTMNNQPVTLTGAPGGSARPVIQVTSAVTPRMVVLRRLHLSGGRRSGIELAGRVEVRVEQSIIDGNQAFYGGGIRVIGDGTALTRLRVAQTLVGNTGDPDLPGNTAVFDGGGIHCQDAQVQLHGAVVRNNEVNSLGGGLYADGCQVTTGPNTYWFPGIGAVTVLIEANRAQQTGGGLYATGNSMLALAPTTPSAFVIRGNHADFSGGGVALVGAGTTLVGQGLSLNNNVAASGGAGYVSNGASLTLLRRLPMPGPIPADTEGPEDTLPESGAVLPTHCSQPVECSEVRFNRAENSTGGAFSVNTGSSLTLQHTVLEGNFANLGSQILLANGSGSRIDNSLFHGNDSNGGDLLRVTNDSSLVLNSVTVADNVIGSILIQLLSSGGGNNLNLRNSIFWQPGTAVLAATAADTVAVTCLNAHEDVSLPALTHAPGFVDAAAGNYRLLAATPNIDACVDSFAGVPVVDILGEPRPVDLGYDNGDGNFDRGAYELSDLIFADDFD